MKEQYQIIRAESAGELLEKQDAYLAANPGYSVIFKRYFLSDATAQMQLLPKEDGAVSYIQQPPLDGSGIAVWLYMASGVEVSRSRGRSIFSDGGVEHIFNASLVAPGKDSEEQTRKILEEYESLLEGRGMDFAEDCVRTWFYVKDIDDNYAGLVKARRENFDSAGLVPSTHYIASTGIAGVSPEPGALVQMDAWSVRGIGSCDRRYLYAPEYLNPTYEYGVTFERGVRFDFSGQRHILISGTASIDNRGNVLHIGDVTRQTERMWLNVEALLAEGGASWDNVRVILVYLRNADDYMKVAPMFAEKFRDVPFIITLAPVCRPDWLIEMECIATI